MESWRRVWREGFAPVLPTAGLEALWRALKNDDARLNQGSTTTPPPLMCNRDAELSGCDAIGWCGWQGENLQTVGEVDEFFARSCFEADQRLGEAGGCRWFLNWFDDAPRDEVRWELQAEIERALEQRFMLQTFERVVRRRQRKPQRQVSAA